MTTVLDYIVATYGRDQIPVFITALGDHANWRTLPPAVFQTSAADFEAGWQAYLAEQFGTSAVD
jgi:hypothetical protein